MRVCQENLNSDFVFITRFPTKKRAFYTYEDPGGSSFLRGFDLLFRALKSIVARSEFILQ